MAKLKQFTRAQFVPGTINEESRTVDVVFATPTPVLRYSWMREEYYNEVLDMAGADLSRAERSGLPVLDNHRSWGSVQDTVIGRAENIRREGDKYVATVRFSKRDNVQSLVSDIRDGIITDISFGYSVDKVERMEKSDGEQYRTYMVRKWTPNEVSFVNIPADPRAGVRSESNAQLIADLPSMVEDVQERSEPPQQSSNSNQSDIMKREQIIALLAKRGITVSETITDEELNAELERALNPQGTDPKAVQAAVEAERKRTADITAAVRKAGLNQEFADELITNGTSIDAARALIIDKLADADPNAGARGAHAARVIADDVDKTRAAISLALEERAKPGSVKLEDKAREYRGMNLIDMAEDAIERAGGKTRGMSKQEVAKVAMNLDHSRSAGMHSTSDFPIILGNTINRVLLREYALQQRTFQEWCVRGTATDFKTMTRSRLGELTSFKKVIEGGEYEYATMGEEGESYKVHKYGHIIAVTWETLINDDLGAFNRLPTKIAAASARLQSDLIYTNILGANPTMSDGNQLFSANHNNLTGTGTAIGISSLGLGRKLIRNQKGVDKKDFLNLNPSILLVGPEQEQYALQYTSANFVADAQNKINVWNGSLRVVVEPRITGNEWYLICEPSQIDTIEYAFLEGEELMTETKEGFDVDGLLVKARTVFGAKAIDWRGMYKNAGALPTP